MVVMVKILLKIFVIVAYLISMAMISNQVGILLALWSTPVGFAIFAFVLPQRFNQWKLFFVWSAAVWFGVLVVATLWGMSGAVIVMIPLSLIILILAIKMMLKQSRPRPDWLWLIISAILSGALLFAMIIYATPLAANRWVLFAALVLGMISLGRRRPIPVWIVGVLLITSLFPIVIVSTTMSKTEKIENSAHFIISSNPESGSKELTQMFRRKAKSILSKDEEFSGAINRKTGGGYEVNYKLQDGRYKLGFSSKGHPSSSSGSTSVSITNPSATP